MIQTRRTKYGSESKTPSKWKWIWGKEWTDVDYKSLPENRIMNFSDWKLNENWVSSTTTNEPFEFDYISKDKPFYGTVDVTIIGKYGKKKVTSKLDTGAARSSIDLNLAKELGYGKIIELYDLLSQVKLHKTLSNIEKEKIEKEYFEKFKKEYPDLYNVRIVKSSSGFSLRPYIKLNIDINGRNLEAEVNITDRRGLKTSALIGLEDLL